MNVICSPAKYLSKVEGTTSMMVVFISTARFAPLLVSLPKSSTTFTMSDPNHPEKSDASTPSTKQIIREPCKTAASSSSVNLSHASNPKPPLASHLLSQSDPNRHSPYAPHKRKLLFPPVAWDNHPERKNPFSREMTAKRKKDREEAETTTRKKMKAIERDEGEWSEGSSESGSSSNDRNEQDIDESVRIEEKNVDQSHDAQK